MRGQSESRTWLLLMPVSLDFHCFPKTPGVPEACKGHGCGSSLVWSMSSLHDAPKQRDPGSPTPTVSLPVSPLLPPTSEGTSFSGETATPTNEQACVEPSLGNLDQAAPKSFTKHTFNDKHTCNNQKTPSCESGWGQRQSRDFILHTFQQTQAFFGCSLGKCNYIPCSIFIPLVKQCQTQREMGRCPAEDGRASAPFPVDAHDGDRAKPPLWMSQRKVLGAPTRCLERPLRSVHCSQQLVNRRV